MTNTQPLYGYVDGYPSLAAFIASHKDGTAAIYKRFDRLAARNLLLLQSELADLEFQLDQFDFEDRRTGETMQSLRNWEEFKERAATTDPSRMDLVKKIRETLKEYREALFFESSLAKIPPPDARTLKAFRYNFFHGVHDKWTRTTFPTLGGSSASVYDDTDDLVVLHGTGEPIDRMSRLLAHSISYLAPLFQGTSTRSGQDLYDENVFHTTEKRLARYITWLSTFLAVLLLVCPITVLYTVESDKLKLGLIALFTVLFGGSVELLSNAKRAEIFASTAACVFLIPLSIFS
ncbi:hypothetical protein B0T20DRAFT_427706 [Sordaria brevicollis]|uniref:DUF6594 domain-containing protein n=1 Tax=Sordaria brevicollis TaxID=83679 RepID=A0AAE0NR88_SORBR|nr:hypothetical protein B0T20DRAFT_427706 [Sordaria brevicollis]